MRRIPDVPDRGGERRAPGGLGLVRAHPVVDTLHTRLDRGSYWLVEEHVEVAIVVAQAGVVEADRPRPVLAGERVEHREADGPPIVARVEDPDAIGQVLPDAGVFGAD